MGQAGTDLASLVSELSGFEGLQKTFIKDDQMTRLGELQTI
jgi:hypothetical protein